MDLQDALLRLWQDLLDRPAGPLSGRFLVQPLVAMLLALRDGVRDGNGEGPTFLIALVTGARPRADLLREAYGAIGRILIVALILDVAYQVGVLGAFYPLEALIVAFVFAFLPYAIARGVVSRIVRFRRSMRNGR